jgi:hypothetical protein
MVATVINQPRNWKAINLGAGGWVTGFDQHTDGTIVVRTDTYGAYIKDPGAQTWRQMVTQTGILNDPRPPHQLDGQGTGTYEVRISAHPTSASGVVIYMVFYGGFYRSLDRGVTWVKMNTTPDWGVFTDVYPNQGSQRFYDCKMAIHPTNPDIVYLGTMTTGLWRTTNGGTTWTNLTGPTNFPSPISTTDNAGVGGIIFDPTTRTLFAHCNGRGYYSLEENSSTWQGPFGPTTPISSCDMVSYSGVRHLWCVSPSNANQVWRSVGGTWSTVTTTLNNNGAFAVFFDPNNTNRIIIARNSGHMIQSMGGGEPNTFGEANWEWMQLQSSDIPWHTFALPTTSFALSLGKVAFDKTRSGNTISNPNKVLASDGIGFFEAIIPSTNLRSPGPYLPVPFVNWQSKSKGIEQLVGHGIASLPNGRVIWTGHDRALINISNPRQFPSRYELNNGATIRHGQMVHYLERPNQQPIVAVASEHAFGDQRGGSEFSLDGGQTWQQFEQYTTEYGGLGGGGGELVPMSENHFLWFPNNNRPPMRTATQGKGASPAAAWQPMSFVPNDPNYRVWAPGYTIRAHRCAVDSFTAGKAWLMHDNLGVMVTTNYGANWTQVPSTLHGAGSISAFSDNDGGGYIRFSSKLRAAPGLQNHLWFATGGVDTAESPLPPRGPFFRSVDGGSTWTKVGTTSLSPQGITIQDVEEVIDFCFSPTLPGGTYPTLWIVGYVTDSTGQKFGVYYSTNAGTSWTRVNPASASGALINSKDEIVGISASLTNPGEVYIAFNGSGGAWSDGAPEGKMRVKLVAA